MYVLGAGVVYMSAVPGEAKEDIGSPGIAIIDSCLLPDLDAGNQTQVLCKSSKCF